MKKFKSFITEAKIKAEDYEAAIVMGFYELTDRPITSDPENFGISKKVFDAINNTPQAKEAGVKIAESLLREYPSLKSKNAEQYGRAKASLTPFWSSFGAKDITPKTDILIGDMRISLKIGLAQLMSGGKSESTATFEAAVLKSQPSLKTSPQYKRVVNVMEGFVKNTLAPGQLRPIIKAGNNPVVNAAEAAHKSAMKELSAMFEQSESFKIEFAREAMSGFSKFGEKSNAAAEFMLVASPDGNRVAIHSVYDDKYCTKIANAMQLSARFKSASRKIKGKKTGEYNFWSVIGLIVDSMQESNQESGEELNEVNILKKVKSWVSKTWNNAHRFFTGGIKKLTNFLGAEPELKHKNKIEF